MRKIPLTQGKFALIDNEDFERFGHLKWYAAKIKGNFYAVRGKWINGKRKQFLLHRLIIGSPKGMMVDHKNHDTLDDRKNNLRVCTRGQNGWNAKISSSNVSGYKGVHWVKRDNRFRVYIRKNGVKNYIGDFRDLIEAAKAYNKAAKKYHGRFAFLNVV